jgi:hypothetical protein
MRIIPRVGMILLLLICLHIASIHQVAAPPVGYGYTCGLVSVLESDIQVSSAIVNATIIPETIDEANLTHSIEVSSRYNLTNTADHEVNFLTSYIRESWSPHIEYTSIPSNITIEGNNSLYNASIIYNISNDTQLPNELSSRFTTDFFSSFIDYQLDIVNLTFAAHANLVLSLQTMFTVKCYGNYFDFRYGLDTQKLPLDSTQLDGWFSVSNTSLLFETVFLNGNSLSVNQLDDSKFAAWSISDWDWCGEIIYPGLQLDFDAFGDYIGVQLWQSQYLPPHIDTTGPALILAISIVVVGGSLIHIFTKSSPDK